MRTTSSRSAGFVAGDSGQAWQAVMVARKALTVAAAAVSDPCFSAPHLLAERVGRVCECHRDLVRAELAYRRVCATERAA